MRTTAIAIATAVLAAASLAAAGPAAAESPDAPRWAVTVRVDVPVSYTDADPRWPAATSADPSRYLDVLCSSAAHDISLRGAGVRRFKDGAWQVVTDGLRRPVPGSAQSQELFDAGYGQWTGTCTIEARFSGLPAGEAVTVRRGGAPVGVVDARRVAAGPVVFTARPMRCLRVAGPGGSPTVTCLGEPRA